MGDSLYVEKRVSCESLLAVSISMPQLPPRLPMPKTINAALFGNELYWLCQEAEAEAGGAPPAAGPIEVDFDEGEDGF